MALQVNSTSVWGTTPVISSAADYNSRISGMCTGKKKQNKENEEDKEQEKIGFTRVHTIGDCEDWDALSGYLVVLPIGKP